MLNNRQAPNTFVNSLKMH